MSTPVYVTVETSAAGERIVGVYSSLEQARSQLRHLDPARLADYRIEVHGLDDPPAPAPWLVVLARDGAVADVSPFIACAGCDEERLMAQASCIERGGERMHVVVWAPTPGQAIAAADAFRRRLLAQGLWGTEHRPLAPLRAAGWRDPAR